MQNNLWVYVAGPYRGDETRNVAEAARVGASLVEQGFTPIVPHLTFLMGVVNPTVSDRNWLDYGLRLLRRCDAVLRIGERTPGTDAEVEEADKRDIPVFDSIGELLVWASGLGATR